MRGMRGKLTRNGVRLLEHEERTVEYFLARGEDVELLIPRSKTGNKDADFRMKVLVINKNGDLISYQK